jgi:DNA-binding PadR family transcriptional regulator
MTRHHHEHHEHHEFGHGWAGDPRAGFGRWGGPPFGPFGGPPFGPLGRGPRGRSGWRRQPRGNVRAAILALLAERPMHGYEMIQELDARTGGVWRPSPGSVYPTLQLLEDEGLIISQQAEGKRLFSLTEQGRAEAERDPSARVPWEQVAEGTDPAALRLRDAAFQVGAAAMQVAHAGTQEQQAAALEVLTDARRRLYAILAEGE